MIAPSHFPLLITLFSSAAAQGLSGRVVHVADGDTIEILTAVRKTVRIRLAEIDAPEHMQPYGDEAKRTLSALVLNKPVTAQIQDTDRYGRSVARIFRGSMDVNAEMVRRGAAWRYVKYSLDGMFASYEFQAKAAHRGLWALQADQRIPPWEWRAAHERGVGYRQNREVASRPRVAIGGNEGAASSPARSAAICSPRRYCSQMNCAEAYAYLAACGPEGIDGDGDGKPCERQCGH